MGADSEGGRTAPRGTCEASCRPRGRAGQARRRDQTELGSKSTRRERWRPKRTASLGRHRWSTPGCWTWLAHGLRAAAATDRTGLGSPAAFRGAALPADARAQSGSTRPRRHRTSCEQEPQPFKPSQCEAVRAEGGAAELPRRCRSCSAQRSDGGGQAAAAAQSARKAAEQAAGSARIEGDAARVRVQPRVQDASPRGAPRGLGQLSAVTIRRGSTSRLSGSRR